MSLEGRKARRNERVVAALGEALPLGDRADGDDLAPVARHPRLLHLLHRALEEAAAAEDVGLREPHSTLPAHANRLDGRDALDVDGDVVGAEIHRDHLRQRVVCARESETKKVGETSERNF